MREFVQLAFSHVNRAIEWCGTGTDEIGIDAASGETLVRIDPQYFRPTEVDYLVGDASKARDRLGWTPRTSFDQLVREMIESDLADARKQAAGIGSNV